IIYLFLILVLSTTSFSQTLGGNAVYNFLKLPSTPMLTAAGGVNISYKTNEVGLSANNPSLMDASLHSQVNASFNYFPGGIKTYSLTGAYHHENSNTSLGGHIYFLDYGNIMQTDAAGNISGEFRPVDFVLQVSVAKQYMEKWNFGFTLKFINSSYQQYASSAIAVDAGIHYTDSAKQFYASFVAKNMGVQLKTYAEEPEDLPFDMQIGITKKLAKAPFGFSLTAQQLHHFDILYNDTTFNNENSFTSSSGFFQKLFNHFVLATHIYIGNHLEATLGYNQLRRSELNIQSATNGLNGFSMGLRVKFSKIQVLYSLSSYQKNVTYNHLGINFQMNRLFGLGKDL
ncbi:MAG: type IX secretion system protein PorQ, partial [Flavisolibacter sp.]